MKEIGRKTIFYLLVVIVRTGIEGQGAVDLFTKESSELEFICLKPFCEIPTDFLKNIKN